MMAQKASAASKQITAYIHGTTDWRGKILAQLRVLVLEAAPDLTEEWKWGTPVWTHNGLVCAAGLFKDHVKLNFFRGASLPDPHRLFNSGLDAKATRAIDFAEGDKLNAAALKKLVRAAVAWNSSATKK